MKENIQQMQLRHEKEIKDLQENCPHEEISDWMDYHWAVGHAAGYKVKLCKHCGKTVESTKKEFEWERIIRE